MIEIAVFLAGCGLMVFVAWIGLKILEKQE
jgi:hypothetical protein